MTDIVLIGHGKMGRAIEELVHTEYRDRFRILNIVEKPPLEAEALQGCDAVIEFTEPGSAYGNIRFCIDHGIPCVSGTTGWTEKLRELQLYAVEKDGSFLYAPNFSIGVNLFFEANRFLAELMDRHAAYDVRIEETHHTEKKDAPSGTALFAALDLLRRIHRKDGWKNRESENAATLEVLSHREKDVPGTHLVRYFNEIDEITLTHTAKNRSGFAAGALLAAEWLSGRQGAYGMEDVLGFEK